MFQGCLPSLANLLNKLSSKAFSAFVILVALQVVTRHDRDYINWKSNYGKIGATLIEYPNYDDSFSF